MIVIDDTYGGLYDKDDNTGDVSKVLRCFHNDRSVTFDRFPYSSRNKYRVATKKELAERQCTYYLEDGSRPLKKEDCGVCKSASDCNHNQKYYDKL